MAVGERHTVEIRTASEVREGDEILGRQYKPVRIGKTEHYPGMVILYRREGPPRHVLQQIGQFAHADPLAVVVGSAEGPTAAEVEGGARVLSEEAKATGDQGDWNPWDRLDDSEKEELRREVRAVLKGAMDGGAVMPPEGTPVMPPEGTPAMPPEGTPAMPPEGTPAMPPESTPVMPPEGTPVMPEEGPPAIPGQGPPPIPEEGRPAAPEQGPPPVPHQGPPPIPEEGRPAVPEQGPPPVPQQGPPPVPQQGVPPVPQQGVPPVPEEGRPATPEEGLEPPTRGPGGGPPSTL